MERDGWDALGPGHHPHFPAAQGAILRMTSRILTVDGNLVRSGYR